MAVWEKVEGQKQTFSDIIRGMQYAVNTAHEMLETYHIDVLNKYFDENGFPKTKQIRIDAGKKIDVPLISLINQSSLAIDELEVEFKARINEVKLKETELEDTRNRIKLDRSAFEMNFTPSEREGDVVNIRIKFKSTQQPEGVARITDEFNKILDTNDLE